MTLVTSLIVFVVVMLMLFYFYKPSYDIKEIPDFLSEQECETLISLSTNRLVPSVVYNGENDIHNEGHRRSNQTWLNDNEHKTISDISDRVAILTGTKKENQELLQLVNYGPGGYFNPHYDACNGTKDFCNRMDSELGPRYLTVLIYLNDSFSGGETVFPKLGKAVIPKKGKAVIFYNANEHDASIIEESYHGGNPVKSGEKWVANKWVRLN
jgi:prolyl 4-hydroxylase